MKPRPPPPQLPAPPPSFTRRKEQILAALAVPDAEYTDASPKGSVDVGIRELIADINGIDGFVTTSSCAGRVSVFVEGRKAEIETDRGEGDEGNGERGGQFGRERDRVETVAAVGGKGGGGTWLFVSHDPVSLTPTNHEREAPGGDQGGDIDVKALLGLGGTTTAVGQRINGTSQDTRLVHFKFEPMILHVLTASLQHAQSLLRSGLTAGFRESGAINLTASTSPSDSATPVVAIRSMGLSFESLIGVQVDGVTQCTVSDEYLLSLVEIANARFKENEKRIARFREGVLKFSRLAPGPVIGADGWEDAEARRERKRAEGLRRKAEIQSGQESTNGGKDRDSEERNGGFDLDILADSELA
ncbi:methyltransferase TYW3-domain-containing protein [Xylariaceae sp. FL0255]|nr:methyltransferase TYW3-domain-containing protein [Xylariaceae sp. FL0255]